MPDFFSDRKPGQPGIALFLQAGDPPLDELRDIVVALDEEEVDCLELAVPFPDSVTDGPVVRASAQRALDRGVGFDEVLAFVAECRPRLRRTRIALLADWSHSMRRRPLSASVADIAACGADGLLTHALPPRLRAEYHETARDAGLPVVTTCYPQSPQTVMAEAAEHASAYLYLVARYGRSGTPPAGGHAELAGTVAALRARTDAPIALGFGVRTPRDVAAVSASGADAAIIGSAAVTCVTGAQERERDASDALRDLVRKIRSFDATEFDDTRSAP